MQGEISQGQQNQSQMYNTRYQMEITKNNKRSLNRKIWQWQFSKINEENKVLIKRLRAQKSDYEHNKFIQERARHDQILKMHSEYPEQYDNNKRILSDRTHHNNYNNQNNFNSNNFQIGNQTSYRGFKSQARSKNHQGPAFQSSLSP